MANATVITPNKDTTIATIRKFPVGDIVTLIFAAVLVITLLTATGQGQFSTDSTDIFAPILAAAAVFFGFLGAYSLGTSTDATGNLGRAFIVIIALWAGFISRNLGDSGNLVMLLVCAVLAAFLLYSAYRDQGRGTVSTPMFGPMNLIVLAVLVVAVVGVFISETAFALDNLWLLTLVVGIGVVIVTLIALVRPDRARSYSMISLGLGTMAFLYVANKIIIICDVEEPQLDRIVALAGAAAFGLMIQAVIPRVVPQQVEVPIGSSATRSFDPIGAIGNWFRSITIGKAILYAILTFAAFISMVPFLWMISSSLMTLGEILNRAVLPADPVNGLCNYVEAWNEANFSRYFMNSVVITTLTITGLLVTSILAAYAFAKINFVGRNLIFSLLLITLMIPESVTMIPNFLIITGNVPVIPSGADDYFGIILDRNWLDTLTALTLPFMASAFAIFLLRQFFSTIPDELWEACRIDGGGHLRFLIQIVLPIARPAILTVTLLTFISGWNAFLWPLIVTRTETWRPLMVGLYNFTNDQGTQLHLLMAGSFIVILPILMLYFATQKAFTEGIATSGLKG
ncbi:MAG: carbohydrate ABC transporter permease [Anaerolineae bacterium]|nr:carbohydrate ABC transporter permease [Anaerolineae bacterium]